MESPFEYFAVFLSDFLGKYNICFIRKLDIKYAQLVLSCCCCQVFSLLFQAFYVKLEGKYSLESTDSRESEIRAPHQLTIALKLSYYLFIIAKLFKVKDGCLKFVYNIKIPGLWHFWTVTSTPG